MDGAVSRACQHVTTPAIMLTLDVVSMPSKRVKDDLAADLDHHASLVWPGLEEVTVRWRGGYGYVTAYISEDEAVPICRLEYLGLDDIWGFALHDPATDTYADSLLPDGHPEGSPQDALDCAVRLHLTDIADKPIDEDD
jgi:hypothetical protein